MSCYYRFKKFGLIFHYQRVASVTTSGSNCWKGKDGESYALRVIVAALRVQHSACRRT